MKDKRERNDEKEITCLAFMAFRRVSSGNMAFAGCAGICNRDRPPLALWLVWGPVFREYGDIGRLWGVDIWKKLGIF